ncbi:MAG: metallophosphoesterase family protein [Bacillota bacterium]|jgi:exonuclease SbcD
MKLLHFADAHIGTENHGRIDPASGLHSRLLDFVRSLSSLVDFAIEEKVDAVLFAGDAYRSHDPNPTQQREFARQIQRLSAAGIPLAMVVGNHDQPVAHGRATSLDIFRTLQVAGVSVFHRPGLRVIETAAGPLQVVGIPWPQRSMLLTKEEYRQLGDEEITLRIEQILTALIEDFAERLQPGVPAVLLGHLAAATAVYSGSERTALIGREPVLLPSVLGNPAFSYVALGHVHRFQDLNRGQQPPVVYSGSIDRVDFGEEEEPKGFCLVEIDEQLQATYRLEQLSVRPFRTIRVVIGEDEDPTARLLQEIAAAQVDDAVVRLLYTISDERLPLLDMRAVQEALADAFLVSQISREQVPSERLRRAEVSRDLSLQEALDRYLLNHPELSKDKDDLKAYAAKLEDIWWQEVRQR